MMKYGDELLDILKGYSRIIVSGPQRTGTRFITNALASDLGYDVIDEVDYGIENTDRFMQTISERDNFVCQAPAQSYTLHNVGTPSTIILFSYRPTENIIFSQELCSWNCENVEKRKYQNNREMKRFVGGSPISKIKYRAWEEYQKPLCLVPSLDIVYDSFKEHKDWVDMKDRTWHGK